MTVWLRCVLLWLSGKWRGSNISSRYVVGNSLESIRSCRIRYGWMGTHVHQVILGVDPLSVGGLDWRSCVCIWYISTWFFLLRFSIPWFKTLVGACFSRILCPRVDCHAALSPTEVVQLDVSRLTILCVLHCNQGLYASVGLSNCSIFFSEWWQFGYVQYSFDISLLFAIDFETVGELSFLINRNSFCSDWWISSALRGPCECSGDNSLSHACPIAAQMLLCRNLIRRVKGEHIPSGSNTAETKNRTFDELSLHELLAHFDDRLWDYLCLHSSSVQELKMTVFLLRKFLQLSLICLPLGFVS